MIDSESLLLTARLLLVGALCSMAMAIAAYVAALAREDKRPVWIGRVFAIWSLAELAVLLAIVWTRRPGPLFSTMADFLIAACALQTAGTLALDFTRRLGILTFGNAIACLLTLLVATLILGPEPQAPTATAWSGTHIVMFLVSFGAFEVAFISIFTHQLLQKFLKSKRHLWLFEMAPSLETTRRTAITALWIGLTAFTAGLLAGYLYAREHLAGRAWRIDVAVVLTTGTWLAYLLTLIFGARSAFRGRAYAVAHFVSFALVHVTLFSTVFWSGLHR